MQTAKDLLGQARTLDTLAAVCRLEQVISEGLVADRPWEAVEGPNVFGRPVQIHQSNDLAFVEGLTNSGLRAGAVLSGSSPDLSAQVRRLADQLLPVVLYLAATENQPVRPWADTTGFQAIATGAQEAADLGIIAHCIAERALMPSLVHLAPAAQESVQLPDKAFLHAFPGDPDDAIPTPTPAQELWFGKRRRRIPNWFNLDVPVLQGGRKEAVRADLQGAARRSYLDRHLPEIVRTVFQEYGDRSGRPYGWVETHHPEKADYLILSASLSFPLLRQAADWLQDRTKARIGVVRLRVVHPFPEQELEALLAGKRAVTLLDALPGTGSFFSLAEKMHPLLERLGKRAPALLHGFLSGLPAEDQWMAVAENMTAREPKKQFFLDLAFTRATSAHPRREVLLQSVGRAYPDLAALSLKKTPSVLKDISEERTTLPLLIRQYQDQGPPYSRISRFFNESDLFLPQEEALADPFQVLPLAPPATAGLTPPAHRYFLPTLLSDRCTGCGACFVQCPHAALPPVAIGLEKLIRSGMEIAARRGTPITGFTPLVKNLTLLAGQMIRESEQVQWKVMDFLPEAFGTLIDQLDYDLEKEQKVTDDFYTLLDLIGDLPIAVTETLYHQPEALEMGKGAFFSLAVDPVSCTGCGICAEVCPEEALFMEPETPELIQRVEKQFQLWSQLPDTEGDTIVRLHADPAYDSLAAILLSRNFYLSMTGAGRSEQGASAKSMLHLVTAVVESVCQPRLISLVQEMDQLIEKLTGSIQSSLQNALPQNNLEKLVEHLGSVEGQKASLSEVLKGFGAEDHLKLLDTEILQRRIHLQQDLESLKETLQSGPTGMGRARYGIVLAADNLAWATDYPHHPFLVPVWVDSEGLGGAALAGMLQGVMRHWLDNLRLIRRARLEAKGKYHPEKDAMAIAALTWDDLEEAEQQLLPPLLLVVDLPRLSGQGLSALQALLETGLPIKVVLLNDLQTPQAFATGQEAILAAMTQGKTFLLQASSATPKQLSQGLLKGIDRKGPALFHLLTPRPDQHISMRSAWKKLPALALQTRAFPVFRFEPDRAGAFLSEGLDLSGNPDPEAIWTHSETQGIPLTFGDWLATLAGWQDQFEVYDPEKGPGLPLADYVALPAELRKGKVPVVSFTDEAGDTGKKVASERVVEAVEAAQRGWNALRDLAGVINPHPQHLREQMEQELNGRLEREMNALRAEYEKKLAEHEQRTKEKMRAQLREKLVSLAQARLKKTES